MAPKPGTYVSPDRKTTRDLTDPGDIVNVISWGWTRKDEKAESADKAEDKGTKPAAK